MLSGTWYHGSPRLFDHFSRLTKYSPQEQLGFGIHFARKVDFAALYGKVIYQCRLFPSKVLNLENGMALKPGSKFDSLTKDFFGRRRPYFIDKDHYVFNSLEIDRHPPKKAEDILKKHGYDAVIYSAKYGTRALHGMNVQHETVAVTILDPSKIRILAVKKL